jgi:hypothetical protein
LAFTPVSICVVIGAMAAHFAIAEISPVPISVGPKEKSFS